MPQRRSRYYYGSYGMIRGYGPLRGSVLEADETVSADRRQQSRRRGGSTDRNAVAVDSVTGLCWWLEPDDQPGNSPVLTPTGEQARYERETVRQFEATLIGPEDMAGFG
jgi:hypothetical protein